MPHPYRGMPHPPSNEHLTLVKSRQRRAVVYRCPFGACWEYLNRVGTSTSGQREREVRMYVTHQIQTEGLHALSVSGRVHNSRAPSPHDGSFLPFHSRVGDPFALLPFAGRGRPTSNAAAVDNTIIQTPSVHALFFVRSLIYSMIVPSLFPIPTPRTQGDASPESKPTDGDGSALLREDGGEGGGQGAVARLKGYGSAGTSSAAFCVVFCVSGDGSSPHAVFLFLVLLCCMHVRR